MATRPPGKARARKRAATPKGAARGAPHARERGDPGKREVAPPPPKRKAPAAPKRPPQVSKERWSKLGPTSRKRAAGFFKKHPTGTYQQMRGHKAGEHVTRKERLQQRMEAFASVQAWRGERRGADEGEILEALERGVREHGELWFRRVEKWVRDRHAEYKANKHKSLGRKAEMEDLGDELDLPYGALFYH